MTAKKPLKKTARAKKPAKVQTKAVVKKPAPANAKPAAKPALKGVRVATKPNKPVPSAASKKPESALPAMPKVAIPKLAIPKSEVERKSVASKPVAAARAEVVAKPAVAKPAAVTKPIVSSTITVSPPVVTAVATRKARPAPSPVIDGEESDDNNGLLAGPRNVQPYIAKRGEQYMSKAQLDHFKVILLAWKRDLMVEVDRTVSHMKDEAANFPDPNDRATQEEEFSLELRTRDRERKLIRKIEEAQQRIEDGSYGYCLETGEEIGVKRLEARPVATLSIEAQERRERRERQYGDRDDRYR